MNDEILLETLGEINDSLEHIVITLERVAKTIATAILLAPGGVASYELEGAVKRAWDASRVR